VEGLRVPQRRRKKRLTGIGVAVGAMSQSDRMIWAMDFQFDTTANGRTLKMLNVIDEFTAKPSPSRRIGPSRRRCRRLGPSAHAWGAALCAFRQRA
jgi:hypothetical protein